MLDDGRVGVLLGLAAVAGVSFIKSRGSRCGCGGTSGSANCGCGSPNRSKKAPPRSSLRAPRSTRGSRCGCGGSLNRGSANCGCGSPNQGSLATVPDVLRAWMNNEPAKTNSMHTDGSTLWSYSTVIGETFTLGGKVAYANPDPMSATTRKHVFAAKRIANRVLEEKEDAEPVQGIAGMRPAPFGERVPRPRLDWEATPQERDWERKGPWSAVSNWPDIVVKNDVTGDTKRIGASSSDRSWDKATKEAARRNKKAVNEAQAKEEKARMRAAKGR